LYVINHLDILAKVYSIIDLGLIY